MKPGEMKAIRLLRRRLARRAFGEHGEIAGHSLRFGGHVAGFIDRCEDGVVHGWIYDATRPTDLLDVELLVDGVVVGTGQASAHRQDLAQVLDDHGLHGFEIEARELRAPGRRPRSLIVRLKDKPRYRIGPLVLQPAGAPLTVEESLHRILDDLAILRDHGLRRLDQLEGRLDELEAAAGGGSTAASGPLYGLPSSSFSGVGRFSDVRLPDATEALIFRSRLEQEILGIRRPRPAPDGSDRP